MAMAKGTTENSQLLPSQPRVPPTIEMAGCISYYTPPKNYQIEFGHSLSSIERCFSNSFLEPAKCFSLTPRLRHKWGVDEQRTGFLKHKRKASYLTSSSTCSHEKADDNIDSMQGTKHIPMKENVHITKSYTTNATFGNDSNKSTPGAERVTNRLLPLKMDSIEILEAVTLENGPGMTHLFSVEKEPSLPFEVLSLSTNMSSTIRTSEIASAFAPERTSSVVTHGDKLPKPALIGLIPQNAFPCSNVKGYGDHLLCHKGKEALNKNRLTKCGWDKCYDDCGDNFDNRFFLVSPKVLKEENQAISERSKYLRQRSTGQ